MVRLFFLSILLGDMNTRLQNQINLATTVVIKSIRKKKENVILCRLHHDFIYFLFFCCTWLLWLKKPNRTRWLAKFLNGWYLRSRVTCNKNIQFRFMVLQVKFFCTWDTWNILAQKKLTRTRIFVQYKWTEVKKDVNKEQ